MTDKSFIKRLLNIPTAEELGKSPKPSKKAKPLHPTESSVAGAWAASLEQQKAILSPEKEPWAAEEVEPLRGKLFRRFLRSAAIFVILLFAFLGVRQMITGTRAPAPTPIPAALNFPSASATAVAERFAVAYYTWDKDFAPQRNTLIERDFAGSAPPEKYGWNGQGKQVATNPYTIALDVSSSKTAAATVTFTVVSYTLKQNDEWDETATYQQTAQIPLALSGGRVVVSEIPGITAEPTIEPLPTSPNELTDQETTNETKDSITEFWKRFGEESDLSSIAAPGAVFTGLGGTATFEALTDWKVYVGNDTTRKATVTVEWSTPNGSKFRQKYKIEIAKVTSGATQRWQVLSVSTNY